MPTIKINKRELENLIGKKFPDDKLADRISYLGTALEDIDENEITVEIFPNRPDLLSVQGFARAFSSFMNIKKGLKHYEVKRSEYKLKVEDSVKDVRPFTACAVIKNLKFDEQKIKDVIEIQEKLHITYGRNRKKVAIGIYPFEKIKMPITFLAKKPEEIIFQPLGYPSEINGLQILSKHKTGREYAHLLEGKDKFPIFVDKNNKILSMPPIINSEEIGKITEDTKDVFIECSGFDSNVLNKCLNMIVTSLADMGGEIYSVEMQYGTKKYISPDLKPEEMKIDLDYVNKRLGLNLKEHEIKDCLERMGYDYKDKKVLIPSYRADVLHQADLIEDIAIAYGYENFKPEIPNVSTIGEEDKLERFKSKITEILTGLGLIETSTYHLTSKYKNKLNCIELSNALSQDYNALRSWMIPSLLDVLSKNKHNEYPQNIFEAGVVFKKGESETGIIEDKKLTVLLCGNKINYTSIKQVFDALIRSLGIKCAFKETEHECFKEGYVAKVSIADKEFALIGELNNKILSEFELDIPVSAFELDLNILFNIINNNE